MTTKHTQGEWKILGDLYTVSDDEGLPVAITALGMRDADECLANARLIAAAPDLLESLRNLVIAADNLDPQCGIPIGYQQLMDAVTFADAAIAKATGASL